MKLTERTAERTTWQTDIDGGVKDARFMRGSANNRVQTGKPIEACHGSSKCSTGDRVEKAIFQGIMPFLPIVPDRFPSRICNSIRRTNQRLRFFPCPGVLCRCKRRNVSNSSGSWLSKNISWSVTGCWIPKVNACNAIRRVGQLLCGGCSRA